MQFVQTLSTSSNNDIYFLIPHCILHGLICVLLNSFSFLFLEPNFLCTNTVNAKPEDFFYCSEANACSIYKNNSKLDLNSSLKSITLEYELFCEKAYIKVVSQTLMLFGSMLPSFISIFAYFSAKRRPYILSASALLVGISALALTLFKNLFLISFFGFLMHMGRGMWYTHSVVSINENYPEKLRAVGLSLLYGIHGCVAIAMTVCFLELQNWVVVMRWFFAIPILFFGSYYFFFYKFFRKKEELNPDFRKDLFQIELEELRREGLLDKDPYTFCQGKDDKDMNYKVLFTKKVLLGNVISFSLMTSAAYIFNTGLYIGGELLLGNIYVNMAVFGFLEAVFSILSGLLVTMYSPLTLLKNIYALIGVFLSLFIFQPKKGTNNPWESLAFLTLVYSTKAALEMTWSLLGNLLKLIVHHRLQQNLFATSQAISRILYLALPYYNNLMERLQVSPFFAYGLIFIIARIGIRYLNTLHT